MQARPGELYSVKKPDRLSAQILGIIVIGQRGLWYGYRAGDAKLKPEQCRLL